MPDKTRTGAESNGRKASGRMPIFLSLSVSLSLSLSLSLCVCVCVCVCLTRPSLYTRIRRESERERGTPDSIEAIRDLVCVKRDLVCVKRDLTASKPYGTSQPRRTISLYTYAGSGSSPIFDLTAASAAFISSCTPIPLYFKTHAP